MSSSLPASPSSGTHIHDARRWRATHRPQQGCDLKQSLQHLRPEKQLRLLTLPISQIVASESEEEIPSPGQSLRAILRLDQSQTRRARLHSHIRRIAPIQSQATWSERLPQLYLLSMLPLHTRQQMTTTKQC